MHDADECPRRRAAIGELAGLAGVSTRPVRHYHAVGLLAERERDVLPKTDPAPVPVDLPTLEKLLGHRPTDVQRRFHRRMRAALAAAR